jgi:hypothetical protein
MGGRSVKKRKEKKNGNACSRRWTFMTKRLMNPSDNREYGLVEYKIEL